MPEMHGYTVRRWGLPKVRRSEGGRRDGGAGQEGKTTNDTLERPGKTAKQRTRCQEDMLPSNDGSLRGPAGSQTMNN